MFRKLLSLMLDPYPLRTVLLRSIRALGLGSYQRRLEIGAVDRPAYGYAVYHAASIAHKLGYDRISVLEFGVATGNGLLNLEYHAREVSKLIPIEIEVYGFDRGAGLPKPRDYRDLPYHWKEGFYEMDVPALQSRLESAKLVLGNVEETALSFFEKYDPAPIGAALFDLDFHSSTEAALRIFDAAGARYLPRVLCFFDDTIGGEIELYNDYTGQRLAINEFNEKHGTKKLSPAYHLLTRKVVETWYHQMRIFHDFAHPKYESFLSTEDQQIPLEKKRG